MTPTHGLPRPTAWLTAGCLLFAAALVWTLSHDRASRAPAAPDAARDRARDAASGAARTNLAPKMARLDFVLKDLQGADVSLAAAKGKVIVLNFWATWCGPCRAEIPDLIRLHEAHREAVALFGILLLDPMGEGTHAFAKEFQMTYPILDGNDNRDLEQAFGPIVGLPTTVIIDRAGRIVARHAGARTKEQLEREILPLLEKRAE